VTEAAGENDKIYSSEEKAIAPKEAGKLVWAMPEHCWSIRRASLVSTMLWSFSNGGDEKEGHCKTSIYYVHGGCECRLIKTNFWKEKKIDHEDHLIQTSDRLRMDSPWNIAQYPTETKKLAPWRFLFIVYMVLKVWLLTATHTRFRLSVTTWTWSSEVRTDADRIGLKTWNTAGCFRLCARV
jgi:hypothetical protein